MTPVPNDETDAAREADDLTQTVSSHLPNEVYDVLKWFCFIAAPAIVTFFTLLAQEFGWEWSNIAVAVFGGLITLLGTLMGFSNHNYNKAER